MGIAASGCGSDENDDGTPIAGIGGASGLGGAGGVGGASGGAGGVGGTGGVGGVAGATGGVGGVAGATGGVGGMMSGGVGGMMTGGMTGGGDPDGGMMDPDGGGSGMGGDGDSDCCPDGDCLCHGDVPSSLTSDDGPYETDDYSLNGTGCIYYPTDAEPPFAAVAISDGYLGSGGCGPSQTSDWGPFLASWGIVTMIIETGSQDQPPTRGSKLTEGIDGFKAENEKASSPLFGKLSGRYGVSGFSMGGGGTTYAAAADDELRSAVGIMLYGPTDGSDTVVPTMVICGASDTTARCSSHGTPHYGDLPESTPKMRVEVSGSHRGQPSAGGGMSGAYGLAWHKLFLEGDERWRPLLTAADSEEDNLE